MQPLRDIHFNRNLQNEMSTRDSVLGTVKPLRDRSDILIFSGVALLTLAIATFNFMNLQVAQFTRRTREVGVRRVIGSSRLQLAGQFLTEAALIAIIAMLLALVLCNMVFPWFNSMVATSPDMASFYSITNISLLLSFALLLGLVAGAYPTAVIAGLSPSNALRGQIMKGVSASRFRSGLIVLQFSISIGLIIASGVVSTQINYAMSKSLGFNPENVVTVELRNNEARRAYPVLRDRLQSVPGIESVSAATVIPTRDLADGGGMVREGGDPEQPLLTRSVFMDDDYFQTLGMDIVAGRALSNDFPSDAAASFSETVTTRSMGLMLNETAAALAGWNNPDEAIGQRLYFEGMFQGQLFRTDYTLVGVVADAHFQSIRTAIQPLSFTLDELRNVMIIKLVDGDPTAALNAIDEMWQETVPEFPIQRSFLSDSYSAFYLGENQTFILFMALTAIAIIISCVGLYALATFLAERRTREIGIRKVLGATVQALVTMLAWDFSRLVLLANLIAWPLAWWAMQQWLTNFAYQTEITIGIFLLAGFATFFMALATTFQRAWSVATSNPVHVLRSE